MAIPAGLMQLTENLRWEVAAASLCGNYNLPQYMQRRYAVQSEHWLAAFIESAFRMVGSSFSYHIDTERKIVAVAFRGSSNLVNYINDIWVGCKALTDLKAADELPEALHNATVHRGFNFEYCALREQLNQVWAELQQKDFNHQWKILLTGHSLGGALATLCASDILLNQPWIQANQIGLVTFGSPRVCDQQFSNWINQAPLYQNIRVEIDGDPVVSLPAEANGAYYHRGLLTTIERNPNDYVFRRQLNNQGMQQEIGAVFQGMGNAQAAPIRAQYDPIDPAISRLITSVAGGAIDMGISTVKYNAPFRGDFHVAYWSCEDYEHVLQMLPPGIHPYHLVADLD